MYIRCLEGWELLLLCLTKCNATSSASLVPVALVKLHIALVVNVLYVKTFLHPFRFLHQQLNVQFGFDEFRGEKMSNTRKCQINK